MKITKEILSGETKIREEELRYLCKNHEKYDLTKLDVSEITNMIRKIANIEDEYAYIVKQTKDEQFYLNTNKEKRNMKTTKDDVNLKFVTENQNKIAAEQLLLNSIHSGRCNIESSGFGNENDNAEMFAYDCLDLITVDDISVDNGVVSVDTSKIEKLFTEGWANYQGEGNIFIEIWESDTKSNNFEFLVARIQRIEREYVKNLKG